MADTAPGADGSELRLAATLTMPGDVLAQFDVALDCPRRDELELIGADGKIVVPDPWICSKGYVRIERDGEVERLPVDAADPYRVEFDRASHAIATGTPPAYGREDAVAKAAALEMVKAAAEDQTLV